MQPLQREAAAEQPGIAVLREVKVCFWCRKPTRYFTGNEWDMSTVDHIITKHWGGTRDESNLVSACRRCNLRRNCEDMMGLLDGGLVGSYSKDGKWVAYATYPDHSLWRSRSDGSERMQLTHSPIEVF